MFRRRMSSTPIQADVSHCARSSPEVPTEAEIEKLKANGIQLWIRREKKLREQDLGHEVD